MISKKELMERICDLETVVDMHYMMFDELRQEIKKLGKEKKSVKVQKQSKTVASSKRT